jgi:hypothetical protein
VLNDVNRSHLICSEGADAQERVGLLSITAHGTTFK